MSAATESALDVMARAYVGDSGGPNMYFVTVEAETKAVFVVPEGVEDRAIYGLAVDYAKQWPSTVPVVVEDRQTGVCWDNPASEAAQLAGDDS